MATANDQNDLLPNPIARKRLSLFRLPYIVCPTDMEHPKLIGELFRGNWKLYGFGLVMFYQIHDLQSSLRPIFGIEQPDLKNPYHVERIYQHREENLFGNMRSLMETMKFERDQRYAAGIIAIEMYESAFEWRNKITN